MLNPVPLLIGALVGLLCTGAGAQAPAYHTVKTAPEKAVKAFENGRAAIEAGDVAGAIRSYRKAIELDSTFIDAYIYLGGAHRRSAHWQEAARALEKAIALSPSYEVSAYALLGLSEWELDRYAAAAEHLKIFLDSGMGGDRDRADIRKKYQNAAFAAEAVKKPVPFNPELLGPGVNTASDEYFPMLTADGQTLIFTRRDGEDENFYQSQRKTGATEDWEKAEPIEGVNTPMNEGAQAISPDGSWLVFTACDRRNDGSQGSCDLYWSQKKAEGWTPPVPFSQVINSPAWESQPTISADGKTIIFSSNRSGAKGGRDLWETHRLPGGKWSAPANLGDTLNTPESEAFPFLHPDGQTLYFTSDGHPGMGGDDIYFSRKQADGSWGKPQNLGFPINTKGNEGNLVTSLDGQTAYFSASRPGGAGGIDIYRFELPVFARPQPVTYARARVTDAATGYPLVARVSFTDLVTGKNYVTANTQKDGAFLVCLPAGHNYALNVSRKGYLFHSEHFRLDTSAHFSAPFTLDIALQALPDSAAGPVAGKTVVLKNVFFDSGKSELQPESRTELDALAALLRENATLRLQINGHTDQVGDDKANLLLSEQRAQAVLQYLVEKGIAPERLRAKGFGESRPVDGNDTPEGRARNRRTEIETF